MASRTTKVRRRVLACARCRKRKLSCDGKVPSCTRCIEAGVTCVGFDSSTQREAPRSIADFLESHIDMLKRSQSQSFQQPGPPASEFPSPAAASNPTPQHDRAIFADSLVNHVMMDITPSFLGITKFKPILSCVVKGTQLPSRRGPVVATDLDENHPRSILNPQPSTGLEGFDLQNANELIHNYLDHIIPQYPIYHRDDITAAFNSVYYPASNTGQDMTRNRFIISLVMAISLSTAARANQKKAIAHAYTLVQSAMQRMPEVMTNDIPGLQAMLLLTQYIFLNPSMADVWLLTGLISQAVIDLGLHQELPSDARISAYRRDMRRRLFWVAWEMEVGVCSIFSRPINLPIRRYDVAFPVDVDDTAITEAGIDFSGRVSMISSRRIWLFRQIEAEIVSVLHQNEPWPAECISLEDWIQKVVRDITAWHHEIYHATAQNMDPILKSRWEEMKVYSDIAHPYILLLLFKPSNRIPQPTNENWLTAFVSAVHVADGCFKQANSDFGNIKYVFHPCHHCFTSAVTFLQALKQCKSEISDQYSWDQIETWMGIFSTFFMTISERWPGAIGCLEEYERLLEEARREYLSFLATKSFRTPQPIGTVQHAANPLHRHPPGPSSTGNALNNCPTFDPSTMANMTEASPAFTYSRPQDWNTEFNPNLKAEATPNG